MKKLFYIIVFFVFILLHQNLYSQNLTQEYFTSEVLPQYMSSGSSTRLQVIFRATVGNLSPNTTYRYFTQAVRYPDLGGTNSGAGNPILINPDSIHFRYTTGPSVTSNNNYAIFKTNALGNYTGWFGIVNTGNARFTAGNYIIPTITIGDSVGVLLYRRALNDSILVLAFGTTASSTQCTGVWGKSLGIAKNILLLFDNIDGIGKPLACTYLENEGADVASLVIFYADSVNGFDKRWGTIIPNNNANGVKRIEQRFLNDNSLIAFNTSSDGVWPSGANTVNPSSGTTPIFIDTLDAPVPVELLSFSAVFSKGKVTLNWKTATEINNRGFALERKSAGDNYEQIAFINGKGTTTEQQSYQYIDQVSTGKYKYRLKQIDYDGSFEYSKPINVEANVITSYSLTQNFPNPFNPSTVIKYDLPVKSRVSLIVYNLLGKNVATLVNEEKAEGSYEVKFDARSLASGLYFYRLQAGDFVETKKMLYIK